MENETSKRITLRKGYKVKAEAVFVFMFL